MKALDAVLSVMLLMYCLRDLEMVPVAPCSTVITSVLHVRCSSSCSSSSSSSSSSSTSSSRVAVTVVVVVVVQHHK
jgi:hypothetical protein